MTDEEKTALTDPDNGMFIIVDQGDTPPVDQNWDDTPLADDQVYSILAGKSVVTASGEITSVESSWSTIQPESLVSATDQNGSVQEEHTGAMIALVPSATDAMRMAIPGFEADTELHITLCYLGEAASYDQATRFAITSAVQQIVLNQAAFMVTGFGAALWNPLGDTPAIVLNVGGGGLEEAYECVEDCLEDTWAAQIPEQHEPWSPHVCLAYDDSLGTLATAITRVGPFMIDRVRVAFGDEVTDLPLYATAITAAGEGELAVEEEVELSTATFAPSGQAEPSTAPAHMDGQVQTLDLSDTGEGAWNGTIVVEGIESGDGRVFSEGSLSWPNLPIPLRWVPADVGAHDGAVVVGTIDQIVREGNMINAAGHFDMGSEQGREAARLNDAGILTGVSVDVDSIKDADVEMVFPTSDGEEGMEDELMMMFAAPEQTIFHAGRIRAATMVDIPAFIEAAIHPTRDAVDNTPAAIVATSDAPWVAGDHLLRLRSSNAAAAHAHTDGDRHFILHHEVDSSGEVGAANITACASGLQLLRKSVLPPQAKKGVYDHLATHLRAAGLQAPPYTGFEAMVAALSDVQAPPDEWFTDPHLDGPTALTVEGRHVFGHGALFASCHLSFPDACVTPPLESEHVYYRLGEVVTASGERVAVGTITLGTGHASTFASLTPTQAQEHYDNTGTRVALVASGNDEHGIWVNGYIPEDVSPGRVIELQGAKLSGDWRRVGGKLRLVAMLAVNVPGFPVPRLKTQITQGKQLSLVASGIVPDAAWKDESEQHALNELAEGLQRRLGRDPQSLAASLRARVMGG